MESILVLVDFDNCRNTRLHRALGNRNASIADYQSVFDEIVTGIVSSALQTTSQRREFVFRLYGGWVDSSTGDPTDLHNMVIQCIARQAKTFRQSRLAFEIALAPIYKKALRLDATLRTEPWSRPEGRVSPSTACKMSGAAAQCAEITGLRQWLKGKCPNQNCSGKLCDIAARQGQKIVDTLIVADSITASVLGSYEQIVVLSADDDMIPAVLNVTGKPGMFSLARFNYTAGIGRYDSLLTSNGVQIYDI